VERDTETYRIKAVVPQVTGADSTGWIWPCLPITFKEGPDVHEPHTHEVPTIGTSEPNSPQEHKPLTLDKTHYPQIGSGVWVMFEGGDPSYPVWIGVMK
jgi:hypothetical protein